jgi:hypothetical protein
MDMYRHLCTGMIRFGCVAMNEAAPDGAGIPGRGLGHHLPQQETAVSTFNTGHEIIPEPGSARRVRDGEPADLTLPTHYPVAAFCKTCGRPIRTERWLLADWYHTEPEI